MGYRDRTVHIAGIGVILLSIGIPIALLGPAEMYCFTLFSEGGPFHYQGFGFGSFMFGNIASQIAGYYLIAALLIPLGYGHLKARRWARRLSVTLLWAWLVVGAPLVILVFFVLVASKELSLFAAILAMILLAASYLIVPGALIRFYGSRDVRLTFERKDPDASWVERVPMPALVLGTLLLFYAFMLHIPILFNGVFPLFGRYLVGLQGILALDLSIACLACLSWGVFRQRTWAWWGSLVYLGTLTLSLVSTLVSSSYADILAVMRFPPREMEFLEGLPLQGVHLAALIGVPLALTLGVAILAKPNLTQGA